MRYLLVLVPAMLLAGPPRYARVGDFDGAVELQARAADPWLAAERNTPIPESARIRTGPASRIELEFDEGSALRLGPESQCEISDYTRLSTGQRVTLLSFDHGVAYVTGTPEGRDSFTLAVPGAQVTFTRGARVRLQVEDQWSQIAILRGAARFSSPAVDMELREGQSTRVEPANPARFFFYKEILPLDLDQWSSDRDDALAAPASAAHVVQRYGIAELDTAGEWILSQDLGAIWHPKVADNWRPYRDGRWRWQDGLGYTWIAGERWGWLPYHYGRWTRLDKLGWVWIPSKNGVFKPGDVYWLRGKDYAGWGPLAPGEQWDPNDSVNRMPQEFLAAYTTYAGLRPAATVIDPAGFTSIPEDPLKGVEFLTALPSPPYDAARLDAVRPLVNATTLRLKPVVEGVTIETAAATARPRPEYAPAALAPIVIVNQPAAPQPPPEPEVVAVPVPVPALVFVPSQAVPSQAAESHAAKPVAAPKPSIPPAPSAAKRSHGLDPRPPKRYKGNAESALVNTIVQELDARAYTKAAADLDAWTQRFRETDFIDERAYYYMLAFHGLNQPVKVLDSSTSLLAKPASAAFEDPMQALSVLYLATANFQKLHRPTREQSALGRGAAAQLLAILPVCFTPELRPQSMSATEWVNSRSQLEASAREILARTTR
jgi:hypothetical protein